MSVRSTTISVAVTVILLACVAYLEFLPEQKPLAPAVPIVSAPSALACPDKFGFLSRDGLGKRFEPTWIAILGRLRLFQRSLTPENRGR